MEPSPTSQAYLQRTGVRICDIENNVTSLQTGMTQILDLAQTQLKQNPSPDRYNIHSTIGQGQKATLGTRTKDISNKAAVEMPSPSTYTIRSSIGNVPGITLGGRLSPTKVDDVPGPG